jgi:hypothetical protein
MLAWLETNSLAIMMRDSLWAYPIVLIVHAIGMALLIGTMTVIALRVLGVWRFPIAPLQKFFVVAWAGFIVNVVSGSVLFLTAPSAFAGATHFFFSPTFRIKMLVIVLGGVTAWLLQARLARDGTDWLDGDAPQGAKALAGLSLVFWFGAIMAGRLTAYLP